MLSQVSFWLFTALVNHHIWGFLKQIGHSFPPHMFSLHKESLAQYLACSSSCSQLIEPKVSELLLGDQERLLCYEFHATKHRVPSLLCEWVSEVAQSCPTLCDPMDCNPPGSSIHGISQAWILEWATIPFARGSSEPRDWTWVSCTADRCFTIWATREAIGYI